MADEGHSPETGEHGTASPRGGWPPSRGFWVGMLGVVLFAVVLAAAGALAATRDPVAAPAAPGAPTAPAPPLELTIAPKHVTPQHDYTANMGGSPQVASAPEAVAPLAVAVDAAQASSTASSPTSVGSSWSMPPAFVPPAPAAPISDSAKWLVRQAGDRYGINVVLGGQDWGADDASQVSNVGAVISAMDMLPLRVTSSVVAGPAGPLSVLSNKQGRTIDGWQPYGDTPQGFYTNSDQGIGGYHRANEVVLATGFDRVAVAHEFLHAYQFRNAGPDEYVSALLGDEMRSFMAATGWRQVATDDEVRAAFHKSWGVINGLYKYEGRDPVYVDERGATLRLDAPNPIEAFAMAGAVYYAHPNGMALPDWPEYWAWYHTNLG